MHIKDGINHTHYFARIIIMNWDIYLTILLEKLRHPNIVSQIDEFKLRTSNGNIYVTMFIHKTNICCCVVTKRFIVMVESKHCYLYLATMCKGPPTTLTPCLKDHTEPHLYKCHLQNEKCVK